MTSIFELCGELHLDPRNLIEGNIDFELLERQHFGDATAIPDRFTRCAFSRRRTTQRLVNFLDQFGSPEATDAALRKLQIRRAAFSDPNAPTNVLLSVELTKELTRQGATPGIFRELGYQSARSKSYAVISEQIKRCGSISEAFDLRVNHLAEKLEDGNCVYRLLSMNHGEAKIEVREKKSVLDALNVRHLGDLFTCALKTGTLAAVTTYLGLPASKVTETHCVHRGDPACILVANFELPRHIHRHR